MRLQTKLILIFLFLAFVPLAISGVFVVRSLDSEVSRRIGQLNYEGLRALSIRMASSLELTTRGLRQTFESFDVSQLSPEERVGLLRLAFRTHQYVDALALVTPEGALDGDVVRLTSRDEAVGPLAGHEIITDATLRAWITPEMLSRVPAAREEWDATGGFDQLDFPHLRLIMTLPTRDGRPWRLLALVSMVEAVGQGLNFIQLDPVQGQQIFVLRPDQSGWIELRGTEVRELEAGTQVISPQIRELISGQGSAFEYDSDDGEQRLVAHAALGPVGVRLVWQAPTSEAFTAVDALRRRIGYWLVVSLVVAIVFGVFFSRTLSEPIQELAGAVMKVAQGELNQYVQTRSRDEIGDLATSFNYMARELQAQKAEIERQSAEINAWNVDLKHRVEERTRELKEAQAYLVHSQKLAAVAELGSGVAHELNNPLAAVLGFVQILRHRHSQPGDPEAGMLSKIEEQAQRCREIVRHLLRFSQAQVDQGGYDRVDLAEVFREVLKLFEGYFQQRRIQIKDELPTLLYAYGNRAQLLQATLQLLSAVRPTIPAGSTLLVTASESPATVSIELKGSWEGVESIQLDGGLGPVLSTGDKDQALSQGLGFWVAQRIIQEHRGNIVLEREEARASLSLTLPRHAAT